MMQAFLNLLSPYAYSYLVFSGSKVSRSEMELADMVNGYSLRNFVGTTLNMRL